MKKQLIIYSCALCLTLTGCGDKLLERSYSTVVPHSEVYWENEDADTLRAENYQDLVNALLILLGEHSESGVVRIYGEQANAPAMAESACVEVQKETALGAFLLDYITYDGKAESGYYELTAHFGYRRTAEEQNAVVNVTSTEALPDLLRAAIKDGRGAVAIRVGYFGTDRAGVMALVSAVHEETFPPAQEPEEPPAAAETPETGAAEAPPAPPEAPPDAPETPAEGETPGAAEEEPEKPEYDVSPWQVFFYPNEVKPGIIEVVLAEPRNAAPGRADGHAD